MEIGIVGLPNVGKSTTFNVLTKTKGAEVANYEFCTIEPNVGVVTVPDPRLDFLMSVFNNGSTKYTPATIRFVDIAGLVKGASKGEGLGNKFMSHIRDVDAIAQVVRVFTDSNVARSSGGINPISDIETINTELMLCDMEAVESAIDKLDKRIRSRDKEAMAIAEVMNKIKAGLAEGKTANSLGLSKDELALIRTYNLLTLKPILYVFNADEDKIKNFETEQTELINYVKSLNAEYIAISAKIESEMSELSQEEKTEFLKELGFEYRGFDEFIQKAYKLLNLISFLTAGDTEVRAWPIKRGTPADKAAGKIHSDIERGFIRAEIMKFDDFKRLGTELKVKEAGLMRSEGRDYIMQDGDIVNFKFNV